jgi:hypothetical protein
VAEVLVFHTGRDGATAVLTERVLDFLERR